MTIGAPKKNIQARTARPIPPTRSVIAIGSACFGLRPGDPAQLPQFGDWLKFCRKIAAIMDLETAAPPESWIEEAVSQFEIMSRELSNVTKS